MSQSKELSTIESLKTTKYVFKWLLVLVIMGIINIILGKSYGPLKENFFTSDLTGRFLSSKKLMMIYTLLCFAVIYGVREKTRLRAYKGNTKEENTEDIKDFLIYIVISLSTFLYASAYIRRKFNSGTGVISGPRQQIDILPTVLELVGAKVLTGVTRGVSLFSNVSEDRTLYFSCWRERRCLSKREGLKKFIEHYGRRTWEMYDLSTDRKEKKNLS